MSKIEEEIINFMGTHECIESNRVRNEDKNVRFTTYGNRAGIRSLKDVVDMLDSDTKERVLDMMRNKKVNDKPSDQLFKI